MPRGYAAWLATTTNPNNQAMKKKNEMQRGYMRFSKAYYATPGENTVVMVGLYSEDADAGTDGEFRFEWIPLDPRTGPTLQMQVFEDTFAVLPRFEDLIERLALVNGRNIQEPEFVALLNELGIKDFTNYEQRP